MPLLLALGAIGQKRSRRVRVSGRAGQELATGQAAQNYKASAEGGACSSAPTYPALVSGPRHGIKTASLRRPPVHYNPPPREAVGAWRPWPVARRFQPRRLQWHADRGHSRWSFRPSDEYSKSMSVGNRGSGASQPVSNMGSETAPLASQFPKFGNWPGISILSTPPAAAQAATTKIASRSAS